MFRPIVLNTKHELGVAAAKQRLSERFESLKKTVQIDRVGKAEMEWTGDTAHLSAKALGQKATATFDVREHDMTISIQLPMALAPFGGAIVSFLKNNADALRADPEKKSEAQEDPTS